VNIVCLQHGANSVLRVRTSNAAESQKVLEMGGGLGQMPSGVHRFHVRSQNRREEQ